MKLSSEPLSLKPGSITQPNPVNSLVDYRIVMTTAGEVYFKTNPASGGVPLEIAYFGSARLRVFDYDTGLLIWGDKITPDFTVATSIGTAHKVTSLTTGKVYALYCRVFSETTDVDDSTWFKLFDFQVPTGTPVDYDPGDFSPFP